MSGRWTIAKIDGGTKGAKCVSIAPFQLLECGLKLFGSFFDHFLKLPLVLLELPLQELFFEGALQTRQNYFRLQGLDEIVVRSISHRIDAHSYVVFSRHNYEG